jgi:hypothetical protein
MVFTDISVLLDIRFRIYCCVELPGGLKLKPTEIREVAFGW